MVPKLLSIRTLHERIPDYSHQVSIETLDPYNANPTLCVRNRMQKSGSHKRDYNHVFDLSELHSNCLFRVDVSEA